MKDTGSVKEILRVAAVHLTAVLCHLLMALSYICFSFTGKIKYFLRLTDKDSCSALSVIWKMKIYCSQVVGFFNRSIFYPFMSEARQINGFWNFFPMLILFPKFSEWRDGSTVLSPLGKGSGICSCFILSAAREGVWINHPSSASTWSQPATQAREPFSADVNENWPGSALIHGKEPTVPQFSEGTKEF